MSDHLGRRPGHPTAYRLWHVPFALRWDGHSWTNVTVPSPTSQGGRLFGVTALSPTQVYAVGQAPNIPSLVMRWNGQNWATESTPSTGTVWTPLP